MTDVRKHVATRLGLGLQEILLGLPFATLMYNRVDDRLQACLQDFNSRLSQYLIRLEQPPVGFKSLPQALLHRNHGTGSEAVLQQTTNPFIHGARAFQDLSLPEMQIPAENYPLYTTNSTHGLPHQDLTVNPTWDGPNQAFN